MRPQEVSRIRQVYHQRDTSGKPLLYQWHRPEMRLWAFTFQLAVAEVLRNWREGNLDQLDILDLGCGAGGWICQLIQWGADPLRLHGIDLLPDRIEKAKQRAPHVDFRVTNGEVPYPDASMDLVCAHTVFSSILDPDSRMALAKEMRRVLRPDGAILIYDFRISHPRNPDTVGIGKREILRLFPGMRLHMQTLTLAPPLARRIARISPWLAWTLESAFPFLRTHALYFLQETR